MSLDITADKDIFDTGLSGLDRKGLLSNSTPSGDMPGANRLYKNIQQASSQFAGTKAGVKLERAADAIGPKSASVQSSYQLNTDTVAKNAKGHHDKSQAAVQSTKHQTANLKQAEQEVKSLNGKDLAADNAQSGAGITTTGLDAGAGAILYGAAAIADPTGIASMAVAAASSISTAVEAAKATNNYMRSPEPSRSGSNGASKAKDREIEPQKPSDQTLQFQAYMNSGTGFGAAPSPDKTGQVTQADVQSVSALEEIRGEILYDIHNAIRLNTSVQDIHERITEGAENLSRGLDMTGQNIYDATKMGFKVKPDAGVGSFSM